MIASSICILACAATFALGAGFSHLLDRYRRTRRERRKVEWKAAQPEPEPHTIHLPFLGNAPSTTVVHWS